MMESDQTDKQPSDHSSASEWENRRLCSDESCIGVIGRDGRCRECGKPGEGGDAGGKAEMPRPEPSSEPFERPHGPAETGAPDDEWENRRLCSDESCIGVIGPDGRCRECGRPLTG
jgi:hypothetical protein